MQKLTKKQQAFIDEYLIDLNATQAAIRAGYSENTAKEIACENLTKPHIQEELRKRMADREKRTEITQDMVLKELASIGFARITDYVSIEDGCITVKDTSNVENDKISAIAGIKYNRYGIELKLYDKVEALIKIGEHLGMWKYQPESTEVSEDNLINALNGTASEDWNDEEESNVQI